MDNPVDVFRCSNCENPLTDAQSGVQCPNCGKMYPSNDGIIDFLQDGDTGSTPWLVRNLFRWVPPIYQSLYFPLFYRIGSLPDLHTPEQEVQELVNQTRNRGIALDVACGPGKLTRELASGNDYVYGLDLSREMLEQAVQATTQYLRESICYVRGNAERLPFVTSSIDVITCSGAFYFFPDLEGVLSEFNRVLRTGGSIAGMSVVHRGIFGNPLSKFLLDCYQLVGFYRVFDVDELINILNRNGFADVRYRTYGCIILFDAIKAD